MTDSEGVAELLEETFTSKELTPEEILPTDSEAVDELLLCVATGMILLMQLGFALVENGSVRQKNSRNILIKNLFDLCVGGFIYWLLGFGIAFG